jgi:hypothetical protein
LKDFAIFLFLVLDVRFMRAPTFPSY